MTHVRCHIGGLVGRQGGEGIDNLRPAGLCGRDRPLTTTERLERLHPALADDSLHAADGVALAVQQHADTAEQVDIIGPIIPPATAALHRLDLGKTSFPEPQHVLRQV